ncbi:hypothetical protein SAMN05443550_103228 [Pedobacter hartonius]|uniref:CHAP domain-containing protein n=2 Tax=Pedobacter hartonius TaxID=425514 RepID=A0A1H4B6Y7_9SPHI|nr:hypothetical protein SAMN05443550_103228 [Pedobacter hartonius]
MFDGPLLEQPRVKERILRSTIVHLANIEIGTMEKTGHNDGGQIERYLATVHLKRGQPYCAAFISWVFSKAGLPKPRSGWSPDMFPPSRISKLALPANLLGIYFPEYGRIAHVGLIAGTKDDWVISVEGNTNVNGSRNGGGVYRKWRQIRTIYKIADWVSERRGGP